MGQGVGSRPDPQMTQSPLRIDERPLQEIENVRFTDGPQFEDLGTRDQR